MARTVAAVRQCRVHRTKLLTRPHPAFPDALSAQFEVVRPLGAGGMGAVWLVRDRMLERLVALKVLLADRSATADRERFLREARTAAKLVHPNIVPIFRADETDDTSWFTMGFVDGESLGDRLRDRGALDAREVVRVLREAAWALAYAHARGVVHRDVKPDNLLLDRESGRTLVTDFGIARDTSGDRARLTVDGSVLGTVHYMSPEQAADEAIDGRSDVYALGVVGYQALSGATPFDGPPQAVLVAHVTKAPRPMREVAPTVPAALASVIERCLAKAPADRYDSAESLADALTEALERMSDVPARRVNDAPSELVDEPLSEHEAMAVWQRAAQLQAEAAHRMERTAMLRASGRNGTGERSATANGDTNNSGAFRARDVEAAAVDAGISRQYVAIALAERGSRAASTPMVVGDAEDRRVTTLLGVTDRGISVARTINATPRVALAALGRVASAAPFHLTLQEVVGGHPLDGGIMRFRVPTVSEYARQVTTLVSTVPPLCHRCSQIDLYDLNITIAARGTAEQPACEIVISGDLRSGQRKNVKASGWTMGVAGSLVGGAGGTWAAMAMGSALLGVAPAAMLAAGSAAVAAWGYRASYRSALGKAREALDELLRTVQRSLDEQSLFGAPEQPGGQATVKISARSADAF